MATPWHLDADEGLASIHLPEGDVELWIRDVMGLPLFRLDIRQNEPPVVDMDVFVAINYGPDPPHWAVAYRGIKYSDEEAND